MLARSGRGGVARAKRPYSLQPRLQLFERGTTGRAQPRPRALCDLLVCSKQLDPFTHKETGQEVRCCGAWLLTSELVRVHGLVHAHGLEPVARGPVFGGSAAHYDASLKPAHSSPDAAQAGVQALVFGMSRAEWLGRYWLL
jgi:hypothetical protein